MTSREKFEQAIKARFGDLIDYRVCKNSDGEYMAWDMQVAWWAWQAAETNMAVQLANAESKCSELAAENAGLKASVVRIFNYGYQHGHESTVEGNYVDIHRNDISEYHEDIVAEIAEEQTPATDAYLAEVRAGAISEYADKRGFSFQHGSIHAHLGSGDVMVGSVTFENGDAGINFAPVREKIGGVGTSYEWTKGKTAEQVDSVFVIASSNAEGLEVIRDKLSESIAQLRQGAAL